MEERIASPPLTPLPEKPATKVDPIMVIVLVCFLSAFFMICVVSAYFRHYAERQLILAASTTNGSETGSMRSVVHGLDPAVIATFARFSYSSVKGIKIGHTALECAVCLNGFQDHETLRLLPKCSHLFHSDCIDTWLASHITCPVCRADLMPRPGELNHMTQSLHQPIDPDIDCGSTEFLLPSESKHDISTTLEMPRSHSTGHSVVVRPIENVERYTLRLPIEARDLFVNPITSLPTSPHTVFPMESSQKMSFRSVSVGSTRRLDYVRRDRRQDGTSRDGSSGSHVSKWWK
ncbi:RING-H2 finger protein ATL11-like [Cynara cardunculus var. scolymus]|uniref:RING-type E3 ubiquitin transferase n=1 Tax=Cynara cardunculus var. scolymus TaxID=59895 RepID=A0A103YCX8_CYNCS|nr:RING-H2 finger protein ATL11-like [Cynara cardunculus var. scolymus]KVI06784.1 Zinc finger, RING/FYVE/PHD-type [Cynara cardunculus var. scolymus]